MKFRRIVFGIFWILFTFLCALICFSAIWYTGVFDVDDFEAVLYTLLSGVESTESDLILQYIENALFPCVIATFVLGLVLAVPRKIKWKIHLGKRVQFSISLYHSLLIVVFTVSILFVLHGIKLFNISGWLERKTQTTTVYEEEYVTPSAENVVFENGKRNLIYIYLESMENTFLSADQGGALPYTVIPELTQLAEENINFSQNDSIGGGLDVAATWTAGAMTAQTSGLPLVTYYTKGEDGNEVGQNHPFLPGAKILSDVLNENGYYQALMVGSDSNFGGRKQLYQQHHTDKIYDLYTAREDGVIPQDYYAWWGFEDKYLFEYAKQELVKMASQEKPFAFTMLTADTHHVGGYVCDLCQNQFEEQYENVYACSSRQVYEFVRWIQEQAFYENTTIVLVGDHCSMDADYIARNVSEDYVRRVYNCIINPAVEPKNAKNREFTTMDMFPTTLAAMGATIQGERLGLGTNLFSDVPTMVERMGAEEWENELGKRSVYYIKHFTVEESR